MVGEDEILELVDGNRSDIDAALKALVRAANRSGGEDNITVVAFEIEDVVLTHDGETLEHVLSTERLEDEDTLSEEDAVPVVDTAVIPTEEIQAELAAGERQDRKVRRRHLRRRIVAWLAVILIVAAVAVVLYLRFVR